MRRRVIAASAALHGAAVLAWLALVPGAPAEVSRASVTEVELVAPPPPPPAPPGGVRAGAKADEGLPVHRAEKPATRPRPRRGAVAAPPPPTTPTAPTAAPAAPTAPDPAQNDPAAPAGPAASGDGTSAAGSGSGTGTGDGTGSGTGEIDRSRRATPLDLRARTLPYTEEAARDHISGDVQLTLSVDATGRVTGVEIRHRIGHGLDDIAMKLARELQFHPALDRAGEPTASTVRWRFHFEPP